MASIDTNLKQNIECPDCGKRSVVQDNDMTYVCLSCNFRRNMQNQANLEEASKSPFNLPFWLSTGLLLLLML